MIFLFLIVFALHHAEGLAFSPSSLATVEGYLFPKSSHPRATLAGHFINIFKRPEKYRYKDFFLSAENGREIKVRYFPAFPKASSDLVVILPGMNQDCNSSKSNRLAKTISEKGKNVVIFSLSFHSRICFIL